MVSGLATESVLPFTLHEGLDQDVAWIPGDAHRHSTFSDGTATVQEVLARGKEVGLGWVIFVEHTQAMDESKFQAEQSELRAASLQTGVLGLLGEEVSSRNVEGANAHLLVYNLKTHSLKDNDLSELDLSGPEWFSTVHRWSRQVSGWCCTARMARKP